MIVKIFGRGCTSQEHAAKNLEGKKELKWHFTTMNRRIRLASTSWYRDTPPSTAFRQTSLFGRLW